MKFKRSKTKSDSFKRSTKPFLLFKSNNKDISQKSTFKHSQKHKKSFHSFRKCSKIWIFKETKSKNPFLIYFYKDLLAKKKMKMWMKSLKRLRWLRWLCKHNKRQNKRKKKQTKDILKSLKLLNKPKWTK